MNRFLHIIINQQSRNSMKRFKTLLIELPKYTNQYKIHITNSIEQLDLFISQLKETIAPEDIVVIVGGDGSLNLGVTMLEKYGLDNILGFIPSGSGNDYARSHDIPRTIIEAIDHFFSIENATELSIIKATEGTTCHYAVNSLGIGVDGLVNNMIQEQKQNKGLGAATYLKTLFSAFKKQEKFSIILKVDDGIHRFDNVQLALFVNNRFFGGGLEIMPIASDTDDEMEIMIADDINFKDLFSIVGRLVTGKSHLEHPKIYTFKTKTAAFYADVNEYGQKDGEVFQQEGYALTFVTKKRKFWI